MKNFRQSLKQGLALLGVPFLAATIVSAQTMVRSPRPVHRTAASRRFVAPTDANVLVPFVGVKPRPNSTVDASLAARLVHGKSAVVGGRTASTLQKTPFDLRVRPYLGKLMKSASTGTPTAGMVPSGIGKAVAHTDAAMSPGLPVNFPGFAKTPFTSGTLPSDTSTVVASISMDVNQDGKPDIVTVQTDGAVNILLNPGSGSFSNWKISSVNQPAIPGEVFYIYANSVDVNKDGYPDLLVTDAINNAAFVYINNKNGTFQSPVEYDFAFTSGATFLQFGGGISLGDANGDGIADLVAVGFFPSHDANYQPNTTISVITMLGNGDGTFAAPLPEQATTSPLGYFHSNIGQAQLADMNKDGKLDIVVPYSGEDSNYNSIFQFAVLAGAGNGTFAAFPAAFPVNEDPQNIFDDGPGSISIGDLNGDGNLDVLFSVGFDQIYLSMGNGDGTFQDPTAVLIDGTADDGGAGSVNFADVNGDGNIDVIAYSAGFTAVYLGQGGGKFSQTALVQLISGTGGEVQPAPADFTGDGKIDVVQVDATTGNIGLFAQTSGSFDGVPAVTSAGQTAQNFQTVAVGDLMGTGFPGIVALDGANEDDTVYNPDLVAGVNDGKGNFTYSTVIPSATLQTDDISYIEPFAVDFNGDGKGDLLLTGYSTPLFLSVNNGDGTYATPAAVPISPAPVCSLSGIDVGDVNGDGYPDIVAAYGGDSSCYSSGQTLTLGSGFYVLLGNGKGGFTSSFTPYGLSSFLVKLADIDGDGKLDMAITDSDLTNNYYFVYDIPGNGDGTFNTGASQYLMENTLATSLVPGDFDGDGKLDLMVGVVTQVDGEGYSVYGTTGAYIMKGNGDFSFQQPVIYTPGLYPVSGNVADFNQDGRPDLMLVEQAFTGYVDVLSGNFTTLVNLGGGAFAVGPTSFTSPQVGSATSFAADFNGDGAIDALLSPEAQVGPIYVPLTELFLNSGGIGITLTSSATSVAQDSSVTLTATLAPTVSSASPAGSVTFYDNGASIGSAEVTAGAAALTLSTLPVGKDVITAIYTGDANFNGAKATAGVSVSVTALAPSFTLAAAVPAALSLTQGQSGVISFTLNSNATFSGSIALSCSGMPLESACTINPSAITLSGSQAGTFSVVVSTTPPNNTYQASSNLIDRRRSPLMSGGGMAFAGLLILLWPGKTRRRRGLWMMMLLVGLGISTTLTGCGGSGSKYPGTTVGSSAITITATSGTITQTQTFTLNINK